MRSKRISLTKEVRQGIENAIYREINDIRFQCLQVSVKKGKMVNPTWLDKRLGLAISVIISTVNSNLGIE